MMKTPSWRIGEGPEESVRILYVTGADGDGTILRRILPLPDWQIHHVRSCREARDFLILNPVPIVLSEARLADGDWKLLLRETRGLPDVPALVVSSRLADERLWAEVLNLGGHDVLLLPFQASEVERVIESALRAQLQYRLPNAMHRAAAMA